MSIKAAKRDLIDHLWVARKTVSVFPPGITNPKLNLPGKLFLAFVYSPIWLLVWSGLTIILLFRLPFHFLFLKE